MELLVGILAVAAVAISALIYPYCPKSTVAISLMAMALGASGWALMLFGPKDYLLRVPEHFATILHPWILGGVASLLLLVGMGGILGSLARILFRKRPSVTNSAGSD